MIPTGRYAPLVFWAVLLLLAPGGCATREFFLRPAAAPWDEHRVKVLDVPAFEANPDAWALAQQARASLVEQLEAGTVRISSSRADAQLRGQIRRTGSRLQHSAPRRVLRPAGAGTPSLSQMVDPYVWEVDIFQEVRVRLSLQLVGVEARTLWLHDVEEAASDTRVSVIPWPGNDVLPPPSTALPAGDPVIQRQLDAVALEKTLAAVAPLLVPGYSYRTLP